MSSATRDKIISLLGAGCSQAVAAEAAGVTPGYVSQLLDEEGVRAAIGKQRAEVVGEQIKQDQTLENAEKRALEKLVLALEYETDTSTLTRSFAVLNTAKRKAQARQEDTQAGMTVNIVLPKAAMLMIQANAQGNVVEVNGKSIAPLPSRELPKMAERLQQRALEQQRPHVVEHQQRAASRDRDMAQERLSVMQDHEMVIGGVRVVI